MQPEITDGPRPGPVAALRPSPGLLLLAVVLTALNLRTAVTSVGPLLQEIRSSVGLSAAAAGLLTSLPVLCFAAVGSLAPAASRRLGTHATVVAALALTVVGLVLRAVATDPAALLACTVVALAAGAAGNVLLPVLVKLHFPDRTGPLTAVYTTALAVGATLAAASAVPLASLATTLGPTAGRSDGWRIGLAAWAFPAAVAVAVWAVWFASARRVTDGVGTSRSGRQTAARSDGEARGRAAAPSPARTRVGWALALYFGAQALQVFVGLGWFAQFYRDAGLTPATAGYVLAFLTALSVPVSVVVPAVAARRPSQRPVVVVLVACYAVAYGGMLVAPVEGAWLWAFLAGAGAGSFPLALTLIGLRSSTAAETASLSGFAQGAGYLLAAAGPLLVGWSHSRGGWSGAFVVLFAALALQLAAGLYAGGPAVPRRT